MSLLLIAILAWLFGLLSPIVLDLNRQHRATKSLRKAAKHELLELSNRLVGSASILANHTATLNRDYLSWALAFYRRYDGPHRHTGMVEALEKLAAAEDQQLVQLTMELTVLRAREPESAIAMRTYPTPALTGALSKIDNFSPTEQLALLEARTQLSVYEALAADATHFFQMTFNSAITGKNRQAIDNNLRTTYVQAIDVVRDFVDATLRFIDRKAG